MIFEEIFKSRDLKSLNLSKFDSNTWEKWHFFKLWICFFNLLNSSLLIDHWISFFPPSKSAINYFYFINWIYSSSFEKIHWLCSFHVQNHHFSIDNSSIFPPHLPNSLSEYCFKFILYFIGMSVFGYSDDFLFIFHKIDWYSINSLSIFA